MLEGTRGTAVVIAIASIVLTQCEPRPGPGADAEQAAVGDTVAPARAPVAQPAPDAAPDRELAPLGQIRTPAHAFTVEAVDEGPTFPPGCGEPTAICRPAEEGYKVLVVWLATKADPSEPSRKLMNLEGVYVESDDGTRTDSFSGGMMDGRLFVGFTPPVAGKNFVLHWGTNAPIPLRTRSR